MFINSGIHNAKELFNQDIEFNLKKIEILKEQIQKVYEPLNMITNYIENTERIIQINEIELFKNVYLNRYIIDAEERKKIENINEILLEEGTLKNAIDQLQHFKKEAKTIQKRYNELLDETYEDLNLNNQNYT